MNYIFEITTLKDIRDFIETHHYSKSVNGVKVSFCFKISENGIIVGAALFGQLSTTAWKRFGEKETDILELRRLVTLDICPRNTESWFISKCLKHIKKNTAVLKVVSYADPLYNHVGYVYQASNWEYHGTTAKDTGYVTPSGKVYHSRALRTKYKGEYKPFVLELRKMLDAGKLESIILPGKHTYVYKLTEKNVFCKSYPKMKKIP